MVPFDNNEFQKHKTEAYEKWGETHAYKEHIKKTKNYSPDNWNNLSDGMNSIMSEFSECMKKGKSPDSDEAKELVKKLQGFITENYYTCTDEILKSLGQMYILDERFKDNINKHADGTAEFINNSIKKYFAL